MLFLRRLDDRHTFEENKANRFRRAMQRRTFPEGSHCATLFAELQQQAFAEEL